MYKLFLCLRYLRSRFIAYLAVLGVALCVFMVLVAISVMNGFLHKIEIAAKGLFGDIVIEPAGHDGLALYDELIEQLLREVPEVEAASPFILSYGMLRVPGQEHYRQGVQIAGIRLPERVDVSDFEHGLFVQRGQARPTFEPPRELMRRRVVEEIAFVESIIRDQLDQPWDLLPPELRGRTWSQLPPAYRERLRQAVSSDVGDLVNRLDNSVGLLRATLRKIDKAETNARQLDEWRARLAQAQQRGEDTSLAESIINRLLVEASLPGLEPMPRRIVLGLGIPGLSFRTEKGQTIRLIGPGDNVTLYVFPLGSRMSLTGMFPNIQRFTVVDDCSTDVASFDSETVYVPFHELQRLNNMGPETDVEGRPVRPGRCSMIHLKVRGSPVGERQLRQVCRKVREFWQRFRQDHGDAARTEVSVLTWRQRQHKLVSPIEAQRTLVVIMFAIISLVSVVLVFVIFYMIVVQKTRDIGVLKAVGGSSAGVAGIFLSYGAAVGLVGSTFGAIGGYYFVRHINPIADKLDAWLGYRVWSREIFFFEKIPNEVDPWTVFSIMVAATAASVLGALAPAMRAARMQPVEALRYE